LLQTRGNKQVLKKKLKSNISWRDSFRP